MPNMSSLQAPAFTVYPGSYNTVPLQTNIRPNAPITPNNEVYIPLQFDWTNLYSTAFPNPVSLCYLANVGLAPGAIDFIRCMAIDNSYNDYDVHIQFLDGFTLTIPAWEPLDVYPIITNQKAFYVWCESPSPINPLTGTVPIPGRHMTTNIFVANANIPPINAKKTERQSFIKALLTAAGTTGFSLGVPNPNSALIAQGVIKQIILANLSTMGAAGAIGVTINVDGSDLFQAAFFASTSFGQNNGSAPMVFPDLNIRASLVNVILTAAGVTSLAVDFSIAFVDHSGFSALT